MDGGPTRRKLLAAISATGIATTAGCLGRRERDVPAPEVSHDRFGEEWQRADQSSGLAFEERLGPVAL